MRIFYFGVHGMPVPQWLEEVKEVSSVNLAPSLRWVGFNVVYARQGSYLVRPVLPFAPCVMRLTGGSNVVITGKSPEGGCGGVKISTNPIIPGWFVSILAGIFLQTVFQS